MRQFAIPPDPLPADEGGTGLSTFTVGDILYASTSSTLARLADVATGNALISGGVGAAPSWGKIGLTTHISGTLAIGNGGTGQTTANAAFNALAPSQTGKSGMVLTTNGTDTSWASLVDSDYVFNGRFDVWQNATAATALTAAAGYLFPDLYSYYSGATYTNYTQSRQTSSLTGTQYCLRYQRNAASTNVDPQSIFHDFESLNSIPYAGKTVTFSFYLRTGANFSGSFNSYLLSGTGTDQSRRSGVLTGQATVGTTGATSPGTSSAWTRYSMTGTVSSSATQLCMWVEWTPSGTAGASDYLETSGWQLDLGSVAQPLRGHTYTAVLEACQRRFFKSFPMATVPAQNTGSIIGAYQLVAHSAGAVTQRGEHYNFPTRMRTAPTLVTYSTNAASAEMYDSTAAAACTAIATGASEVLVNFSCTGAAGTAVGNRLVVHFTADARF